MPSSASRHAPGEQKFWQHMSPMMSELYSRLRNRCRAGNKRRAGKFGKKNKRGALNKRRVWKIWQKFEVFVMKKPKNDF